MKDEQSHSFRGVVFRGVAIGGNSECNSSE